MGGLRRRLPLRGLRETPDAGRMSGPASGEASRGVDEVDEVGGGGGGDAAGMDEGWRRPASGEPIGDVGVRVDESEKENERETRLDARGESAADAQRRVGSESCLRTDGGGNVRPMAGYEPRRKSSPFCSSGKRK